MHKPIKVAQSQPDEEGNYVTYYVMYSEEKDRYMIDIHFTGELDSEYVKGLLLSFLDDCAHTAVDMFNFEDIGEIKHLH